MLTSTESRTGKRFVKYSYIMSVPTVQSADTDSISSLEIKSASLFTHWLHDMITHEFYQTWVISESKSLRKSVFYDFVVSDVLIVNRHNIMTLGQKISQILCKNILSSSWFPNSSKNQCCQHALGQYVFQSNLNHLRWVTVTTHRTILVIWGLQTD